MKETKLRIHTWPDQILKKQCKKVTAVNEEIRAFLNEMHALMVINKGVGLAANQVGLDVRLIIVEAKDRLFKLVNPCIVKAEGSMCFTEGCLSFPGVEVNVKRAKKVWVTALDEYGKLIDIEAQDVLSVIFQHEIDHIEGITFIERLSLWEKARAAAKLQKMKREKRCELPK